MKKLLAVLCASLCLCFASAAYAEDPVGILAGDEEEVTVGEVFEAVGNEEELSDTAESETTVTNEADLADTDTPEVIAENETATGETDEYNLVSEDEIIVNYASSHEELPNIDVLVWSITGILVFACLLIIAFKIIQKRRMR